jgi:glucose/mannose-6-phosphate isomerase
MNLDHFDKFAELDPSGMLAEIDHLPEQLEEAWQLGFTQPLPKIEQIDAVVISGMGGSAIGADLLAACISDVCPVPVFVHRDYGLPAWTKQHNPLVILSSHSGNTEETLSAFDQAVKSKCQIISISTGGKLLEKTRANGLPVWTFVHKGQPRAAVGFSFGLLLALFVRLGLIPNVEADVKEAVNAMKVEREKLKAQNPVNANPAKRLAGQMVGRMVTIFGAGHMAAVARRWKCQLNEVSKTFACYEPLPEADHNTLAGISYPVEDVEKKMAFFLHSAADLPRNALRLELTRQTMMVEGINTDSFTATGKSRIEQLWRAIQLGDYISYYLAMAYDTDPTAIPTITNLKTSMSK